VEILLTRNFDPSDYCLTNSGDKKMVNEMIDEFGKTNTLQTGHGILPNIPVDHAKAFVDAVKEYKQKIDARD
jgi:uroporphyrinogen decarboxylase